MITDTFRIRSITAVHKAIIGAVAGGLLGNEVARRGNKTEGSIIGAAVGALAGRAIDKSDSNCRRYR